MTTHARFPLPGFDGVSKSFYLVERQDMDATEDTPSQRASHHIIVVDRSGSMYYEIRALRDTLVKLLTLEEYANKGLRVSLISYSSEGDYTLHFERQAIEDVMRSGSPYVEEIRKLRVTGLTCISQALRAAGGLVQDGELTAITLHSDGFANDRSPSAERREIDQICNELAEAGEVFVNTIAYSNWSDFKLLSRIANSLSGVCIQATDIKHVYDSLRETENLLVGQVVPAVTAPVGGADYQVFVTVSGRKCMGSRSDMVVKGVSADDDRVLYHYHEVTEAEYNASSAPICGSDTDILPVLAFARTNLSEGNLNRAKYALTATRDATLLGRHARAMVNEEIAKFATDLDLAMFVPESLKGHDFTSDYGLDTGGPSVLDWINVLRENARELEVDLTHLSNHYTRRGVKRIQGKRDRETNEVEVPWLKTVYRDDGTWARVSRFDINRNTATINMLVRRGIKLVHRDDPEVVIDEVAGIDLSGLESFNNYTVIGDGNLNLTRMLVRVKSKKAHRALEAAGMVTGEFTPGATHEIVFEGKPVIGFDQTFQASTLTDVPTRMMEFKVVSSLLGACTKGESDKFTPEQVEALKRHYLSPSLYVNIPTTTPYDDLQQALATGEIDTRLSYKVDIGTTEILHSGQLYSANAFLKRMFTVTLPGETKPEAKPTFAMRWIEGVQYGYKKLSARTKLGPVDDLMKPIFEDFLGLAQNGRLTAILQAAGAGDELIEGIAAVIEGTATKDAAVETLSEAVRLVDRAAEALFRDNVSPLVFYIGSTGLIPDDFGAQALPADALAERHPLLKFGKAEKEGTFFQVGDSTVISVYTKGEYFSTGRTAAQAAAVAK